MRDVRIIGGRCASKNPLRPVECLTLEEILGRAFALLSADVEPAPRPGAKEG